MLIAIGDRSDPASYDVRQFVTQTDGRKNDYPPGMMGLFKSVWKPIVQNHCVARAGHSPLTDDWLTLSARRRRRRDGASVDLAG